MLYFSTPHVPREATQETLSSGIGTSPKSPYNPSSLTADPLCIAPSLVPSTLYLWDDGGIHVIGDLLDEVVSMVDDSGVVVATLGKTVLSVFKDSGT